MDVFNQCSNIRGYNICMHHLVMTCVAIVMIYVYLVANYLHNDILEKKVANCNGCDGWAMTHMFFFMAMAFIFPNRLFEIMILGVIWEFIETHLGSVKYALFKRHNVSVDPNNNVLETESMWYGRVTDIAFNLVGAIIGVKLSEIIYKNK